MKRLEFWPDYGGALLHDEGKPVDLDGLGLESELVARVRAWLRGYDDSKVDPIGWDQAWVDEGRALFKELREALAPAAFDVEDWEGLWARSGSDERATD